MSCTYIHEGNICRLICIDNYPSVEIRISNGTYKTVSATTLFHITLNDELLDKIATETKELPEGKLWIFARKGKLPCYVLPSQEDGKYNFTNPVAIYKDELPFPIYTLDSLQDVWHIINSNLQTQHLYTRLKNTNTIS